MKRLDRLEQMVERLYGHVGSNGSIPYPHITALLRRQHAAYVRMVTRLRHTGKKRTKYQSHRETKCAVISAYTLACDDVLAALARYRKGAR